MMRQTLNLFKKGDDYNDRFAISDYDESNEKDRNIINLYQKKIYDKKLAR